MYIASQSQLQFKSTVLVHIYTDGSVLISHGGIEMGQGLNTKLIQVASRALQLPSSKIHIQQTSTEVIANASPTGGSTGTDINGSAVLDACNTLLKRLAPYRSSMTWEQSVTAAYFDQVNRLPSRFEQNSLLKQVSAT